MAAPLAAMAEPALSGRRIWIGPEYWANPLRDWRVEDGWIAADAGVDRTLHCLTRQLAGGPFMTSVEASLDSKQNANTGRTTWAGFRIGVRGLLDEYRHALVHPTEWVDAAIRGDGRLVVDGEESPAAVSLEGAVKLELTGDGRSLTLRATSGPQTIELRKSVDPARWRGNLALVAATSPTRQAARPTWRFRAWEAGGDGVSSHPERAFGPVLWTQYTLSGGVLKVSAQFPPLGEGDEREARLEIRRGGRWTEAARAPIDPMARLAVFKVRGWAHRADVVYRVAYRWQGRDHAWEGVIRREPAGDALKVGVFSCDNGYAFPSPATVAAVKKQDPDLLYFAGDQIYEGYGGFGFVREPVPLAMLDYLRKYYQFGWTWRELLRDRPSVIVPDDHDVFQGNIWGQAGRPLPTREEKGFELGGYKMAPEWVIAVEKTQAAHLPDPADPRPIGQGIGVYFTELNYGGVSFAILEDRKFKTGPGSLRLDRSSAEALDAPGAELLGERQESFLRRWVARPGKEIKAVLSQTIFCKVTTHAGAQLRPNILDLDCNAWPQTARTRALRILKPARAVMMHGDQHVGALVHLGIDIWEDGPVAFMVPGTANGFPRAWWPEEEAADGRYLDSFGHRMTVMAVANPEKGSNLLPRRTTHPEELAHRKGSGWGIVRFDLRRRTVTFEIHRTQGGLFPGFPRTVSLA